VRRAHAAPSGLPPLRHLSRAAGGAGEGRLILASGVIGLFPGQGAQRVGMGRELAAAFACARAVFEEVDAALGFSLSRVCFEGPAEMLELTEHAQPALLACSVAAYRAVQERIPLAPVALAGHSLGEWSALVVAGALALGDAARGVRARGRLMQDAVPVGVGSMAAVMGLDAPSVAALCAAEAQGEVVAPANVNGAGQVVVAGHRGAVDRVVAAAKAQRAKAMLLPVSAPFHCGLMAPAGAGVGRFLADVELRPPAIPVYSSVEPRLVRDPADARGLLERQVTATVRWEETMAVLGCLSARLAVEFGVGRTLAGLWKRTHEAPPVLGVADPAGVEALCEALG
jgi:[acyl-carrier-protein] S-malonyltransferase